MTALHQFDGSAQTSARVQEEASATAPARLLNIIGRGIAVGVGDETADIVFDLVTYETRVFDVATPVSGVWIKRVSG